MKVNLATKILMEVAQEQANNGGVGVKLSSYRKTFGIPTSTFHRHLSSLVSDGFLIRVGRDRYSLSSFFINLVKKIPSTRELE